VVTFNIRLRMTAKELLDVLLRITGVWLLILGIRNLVGAAYYSWRLSFDAGVVGEHLLQATPEVLIGLFLLANATRIARSFYSHEE